MFKKKKILTYVFHLTINIQNTIHPLKNVTNNNLITTKFSLCKEDKKFDKFLEKMKCWNVFHYENIQSGSLTIPCQIKFTAWNCQIKPTSQQQGCVRSFDNIYHKINNLILINFYQQNKQIFFLFMLCWTRFFLQMSYSWV